MAFRFQSGLIALAFAILSCTWPCSGQIPRQTPTPSLEHQSPEGQGEASAGAPVSDQQLPGSIRGTVVDRSGAVVAGARVKLTREDRSSRDESTKDQSPKDPSPSQEVLSGGEGQFSFSNVAPGPFQLTITSAGFATQTLSGVLHPGEIDTVSQIALNVAEALTEVQVRLTQTEVAEEQIKVEEKQRVLGAIPNFYVSYVHDAAPLNAQQKFKLAGKTVIDPFTFVVVGGAAGVEQAQNHFSGYGQGAQGYGNRFGAGYADAVAGTFIGAAILPSLLKQDPRYFYKGTGSKPSRFFYAIANSFICKGDNGRWQANYSNILGNLAAGGISNLYYPEQDRSGADLTFENGAIGIGATAVANLLQEFVIRKLTPKLPGHDKAKP
jgi:hypothetical protein